MTETESTDPKKTLDQALLGQTSDSFFLRTADDNKLVMQMMLRQASRLADIFSRDLDPRILDDIRVTDALSALARRSKFSRIRILIAEPETVMMRGHRWLNLIQRLSSRIEVKIIHDDYRNTPFVFSVVDECGLIYRAHADEMEAVAYFHHRRECADKLVFFNEVWDNSRLATEFRSLFI